MGKYIQVVEAFELTQHTPMPVWFFNAIQRGDIRLASAKERNHRTDRKVMAWTVTLGGFVGELLIEGDMVVLQGDDIISMEKDAFEKLFRPLTIEEE